MANFKRTYINADEELVIQGKLTIEGEMIQKEFVETSSFSQTNFDGDLLVINADGWTQAASPVATNSELKLRSGNANASLLFNSVAGTLTLSASPAITTTLTVDGDISATDITSSGVITGSLTGTASLATQAVALQNARNFSIAGGGITATAVSFDGSTNIILNAALDNTGVSAASYGSATAIPTFTVNIDGQLTAAADVAISGSHIRGLVSHVDAGGDGSFAYNNSTGVFTYTGPSATETRAHFSGGTGISLTAGTIAVDFTEFTSDLVVEGSTNKFATQANTRTDIDAYLTGSTGITYNSGAISVTNIASITPASYGSATAIPTFTVNAQGQLTASADVNIAVPSTQITDFSEAVDDRVNGLIVAGTGITKTYNDGANTYTLTTTDADIVHDSLSGFVANEHIDHSGVTLTAGTGLTGGGTIAASRTFNIDNTVTTLTGSQTLTNKTLTNPVISNIAGNSQITGDLNVTGAMTIVGNLNSATQTDSFITTRVLSLNVGGGSAADASRVEVDRTGAGSNVTLRWNETSDRWMFSNNGSTNNNMLLMSDFSGGTGITFSNGAIATTITQYTDALARAAISVTDTGGDGSLAYNNSTGVLTFTGPSAAEVQTHIDNSASNVRAHFSAGTAIAISSGAISLTTVPTIINFTQGHVKFDANSIGIGPSAGTFAVSEANSIAIGNMAGTTTQQSGGVAVGLEAGKTSQIDAGVALGWKAGWNNQGGRTIAGGDSGGTGSAVAIGTTAGYTNQGQYAVAIGSASGRVQQQEHSIAIGRKAGETGQKAYSIAIGVEAGETTQGDYSIAIGHKAGETSQAADSIVLRAGDSAFPYPAAATAGATYISPLRNTTADTGKVAMYNDSTYELSRVPSTIFVSSTANQTVTGTKTFTGALIVPASATATNGAIYVDNSASKAYVYVNGSAQEITPASSVGTVEDVGASGTNIYAGARVSGSTTYHAIKSLAGGTGVTLAETGNVVTVTTDAFRSDSNVRALFSAVDSAGDGSFSYNNGTGQFTYSGITAAQVRSNLSATGLVAYNSSTGAITTTADNYSSFTVRTDTGVGGDEAISSGEVLSFVGGTNITVTNTGNTVTIRNDNSADLEAVTAGAGLTGGGNSGAVTLNVVGGSGITANADDIAVDSTVLRTTGGQTIAGTTRINQLSINGAFTFPTADGSAGAVLTTDGSGGVVFATPTVGDITEVVAGTGLTGGGTSGSATLNVIGGTGITANANDIAVDTSHIRGLISAGGDLAYNSSTGVISFTNDAGDITGVTAGVGLSGGGTSGAVTLDVIEATSSLFGGVKTGFTESGKNYPIELSSGKMFVNVPWTDTTYTGGTGLNLSGTTFNVTGLTISELAAGSLQLGSESFVDNDTSLMTSAAIQDKILSYGYTTETGDITGVTAGTGLTGGGTGGAVTLNVSGLTVAELAAGSLQLGSESFTDSESVLMTSAAIKDKIESYSYMSNWSISAAGNTSPFNHNDILSLVGGTGISLTHVANSDQVTFNTDLTDTAVYTSTNTPSKAVVRDGSGNFAAGVITATATTARYADLAEKYHADADYEAGTVLIIGGQTEVTVTDQPGSYAVAGVVSTDPAYLMNADTTGVAVALRGRVPCKVIGNVNKGDVLITSGAPGFAMVAPDPTILSPLQIIGRALSNKTDAGSGVIEIIV